MFKSAFGYSVAVSDDWMVVGGVAYSIYPTSLERGMIAVFQRNHTANSWELFQSHYHDSGAPIFFCDFLVDLLCCAMCENQ